jgi:thiol-disulfide isomerase/thioredoxin
MMKRLVSIALLLCIITLIACTRKEAAQPPIEGMTAPDFTVRDFEGKVTRLSDLKGKVALVNFWATWCPPCREEVPSMMELNRLMAGKPFRMLAISIDQGGKAAVEAFFKLANTSLPAYLDSDGTIGKIYGITGVPETFVIDRKGVIIKKVIGPVVWSAPEVVKFLNEAMQ